MPQPAKVCVSLNLFAGLNCSWPVSVFSKLLLETCTYVQIELSVRKELRQGMGVDTSFSGGVKSPSPYREVREGCPLQHHDVVSAASSPPCPLPNLGCVVAVRRRESLSFVSVLLIPVPSFASD